MIAGGDVAAVDCCCCCCCFLAGAACVAAAECRIAAVACPVLRTSRMLLLPLPLLRVCGLHACCSSECCIQDEQELLVDGRSALSAAAHLLHWRRWQLLLSRQQTVPPTAFFGWVIWSFAVAAQRCGMMRMWAGADQAVVRVMTPVSKQRRRTRACVANETDYCCCCQQHRWGILAFLERESGCVLVCRTTRCG